MSDPTEIPAPSTDPSADSLAHRYGRDRRRGRVAGLAAGGVLVARRATTATLVRCTD
ncbi:MAG: hypothetical protein JF565_03955 [Propionibacteriales bacterium]|nr:hypothetical protein [Propionibacteriales bacterium]